MTPGDVDVHALKSGNARALDIENVILRLECILLAVENKSELRERGDRVAIDSILASPSLLGTDPEVLI